MWRRGNTIFDCGTIRGKSIRVRFQSFHDGAIRREMFARPMQRNPVIPFMNGSSNFRQRVHVKCASISSFGNEVHHREDNHDQKNCMKRRLQFINLVGETSTQFRRKCYGLEQRRWSGTNKTVESDNGETDVAEKNATATVSANNRRTDPVFASYLTGEMNPPSILNELTKLSASSILNQRRTAAAKRSRSFALNTKTDKETYRQIIDFQILQKEKSHRKTAFNVNRALIGNVIICTGMYAICL
jgi:hypothetical protein